MAWAGSAFVALCAAVTVAAIILLVVGEPLAALAVVLSPLMLMLAVFVVYALLAVVALVWGRLDALRRGY